MIPKIPILEQEIKEVEFSGKTFKIELDPKKTNNDRINGFTDEINAIVQAIYLILSTERYAYPIYSWDYGVELDDLYGQPIPFCMSEIPRRVKEALLVDNRITDVKDFNFEQDHRKLLVTFTVITTIGSVSADVEVNV